MTLSLVASSRFEDDATAARALSKQSSIDRSRAAIQVLNAAAQLLRTQSELMASSLEGDSNDEVDLPTPEMHKSAVQRFLSRRLSRHASRTDSSCSIAAAPTDEAQTASEGNGAPVNETPCADAREGDRTEGSTDSVPAQEAKKEITAAAAPCGGPAEQQQQ